MVIGENSCQNATPDDCLRFKTLTSATAWIADYLMQEPITKK